MENRNKTDDVLGLLDGMQKVAPSAAMLASIEASVLAAIEPKQRRLIPLRSVMGVAASFTLLLMLNYYAISTTSDQYMATDGMSDVSSYDLLAIQTLYYE